MDKLITIVCAYLTQVLEIKSMGFKFVNARKKGVLNQVIAKSGVTLPKNVRKF